MLNGFLCLSRERNESIMIGEPGMQIVFPNGESITLAEPIEVQFMRSKDGKPMLGTKAPRQVSVHRREIFLARQRECGGE